MRNEIWLGDCLELMKNISDNYIDAIVTDPPYGLKFMGKKWDYEVPSVEIWKECLRVLKPGGYLLSFAGTRTQHRMACNIEDAGFEIRDMIVWVYGSGFPKSLDIGKAIDKLQGNEREILGGTSKPIEFSGKFDQRSSKDRIKDKGNSEWEGWGTALKPAFEPITIARKPLSEKTVAENVLKWGTGGINIDECRVEGDKRNAGYKEEGKKVDGNSIFGNNNHVNIDTNKGRFPANFIHDGSEEVLELFPDTKSGKDCIRSKPGDGYHGNMGKSGDIQISYGDSGSAARFFYCAKASKSERDIGCDQLEDKEIAMNTGNNHNMATLGRETKYKNNHPTVKPIKLMEYLIKLVSKENSLILDPFLGSGTTILACINTNRDYIGIEKDENYFNIAKNRINGYLDKLLSE